MKRIFVLSSLFVSIFFFGQFFSASASSSTTPTSNATLPALCALTDNNVSVLFLKGSTQLTAGSSTVISGFIKNKNPYPITDVSMVVRFVKLAKTLGSPYDVATDTVLRVVPLSGMFLSASSTNSFSFSISALPSLVTGPYFLEFFLVGSDQFAIGGNEYLGIPVASYPLLISGNQSQTSFFDTSTIKVNGVKPSAEFLSTLSGTSIATTSVTIVNTYTSPRNVYVLWSVYSGNFAGTSNLVYASTSIVNLDPKVKNTISFTYSGINHSKYLLTATLIDGNKSSFFSDRISRTDVYEPSVRSLFLNNFPPTKTNNTISGCLTQSISSIKATTTVMLSLTDSNGVNSWSGSFVKNINSAVYPFQIPFVLKKVSGPLTLNVKIMSASGSIASFSSVKYVCSSKDCPTSSSSAIELYIIVAIVLILIIILTVVFLKRKKSIKNKTQNQTHV